MALEPITRQEKIIAGQDLTPITRMEMFLKQYGGGGGGGGGSVPKPLTYDYMPEGYPSKSGWSIEWDGNTNGLISFTEAGKTFYKVSDMLPTYDDLIGATIEQSGGLSHELTSIDINAPIEDITIVSDDIWIVRKDITAPDNSLHKKGTYFNLTDTNYVSRLSKQTVTPMAEEFLPATAKNTTVFYT